MIVPISDLVDHDCPWRYIIVIFNDDYFEFTLNFLFRIQIGGK